MSLFSLYFVNILSRATLKIDFDIELAVIQDRALRTQKKNTEYSFIRDELARRTFAESGDYMTRSFSVALKDSLDDNIKIF